jgi:DNA replication ATP-dependent helicase Dna2
MPGTGKTTTIAKIIQALVSQNKRVLVTSYTHSAVDNVLLKVKSLGVDFLRLGSNLEKIHPGIHEFSQARIGAGSVDELAGVYEGKMVVATTCLGIKHALFARHRFDYCIVDEASQLTLPVCIGPLRFADKFILGMVFVC